MSRDDLMRKVKGLLAIANGSCYPAEAETALAKAQAMMLEHGLSQLEVEASGQRYSHEEFGDGMKRRPPEDFPIAEILETFFFVRVFWGRSYDDNDHCRVSRRLFGEEHHRAVAEFVWVYLQRTFRALWNARVATLRKRAGRQLMFYRGLKQGLRERLRAERHQHFQHQAGLILATNAALSRAVETTFANIKTIGPRPIQRLDDHDYEALTEGRRRGQSIAIPGAIADKAASLKLLEAAR